MGSIDPGSGKIRDTARLEYSTGMYYQDLIRTVESDLDPRKPMFKKNKV
jgi:hypothetical protein